LSFGQPSWSGVGLIGLATMMLVVGELSAFFLLAQLGFIIALLGIVLCLGGFSLLRLAFVPIAFLVFAIPLPYFVDSELSWRLQILSSQLGVWFIRLFGVPVYLTGNIIDLGIYKLQVAEACSGLRYLYPLLSFGFLAGYFFQAPFWQRVLVFLSAIPITILMNSFRIGLIGVLVDRWGIAQAEGLLHFFEGWVIFIACAAILAAEILLLAKFLAGKSFFDVFRTPTFVVGAPITRLSRSFQLAPSISCLLLLLMAGLGVSYLSARSENIPQRHRFVEFPKSLSGWEGRSSLLEPQVEHALGLSDYILSDYRKGNSPIVNFYVAYYATQRKGSSPHSPAVCIPGDGWQITGFERISYQNAALNLTLPLNRVIISRDKDKQLVYYWFVQRGSNIANEYWSKWRLFTDAITKNRTDGALVRLVTPILAGESESAADLRLRSFIDDLEPHLPKYLPPENGISVAQASEMNSGGRR
jgi:exosortase D (VPLPA-CTERM-specific)